MAAVQHDQGQDMDIDEVHAPLQSDDQGQDQDRGQDQDQGQEQHQDRGQNQDQDEGEENWNDAKLEGNYKDVLHAFSEDWLFAQLSHKVSLRATNKFWSLSMRFLPRLQELHDLERKVKPIPQFVHQRRQLYKQKCPQIQMEFAFRKKVDGSIRLVKSETAPVKELERNPEYEKLYEIASIKVQTINYAIYFFSSCTIPILYLCFLYHLISKYMLS